MKKTNYRVTFRQRGDYSNYDVTFQAGADLTDDEVGKIAVEEMARQGEEWNESEVTDIKRTPAKSQKRQTITVVVCDGGITNVTGIPAGVTLKVIDADWDYPQAHLYKKGGKHEVRQVTDTEREKYLGEEQNDD